MKYALIFLLTSVVQYVYAQTPSLGVNISMPLFMEGKVEPQTGTKHIKSDWQPALETRICYKRPITKEWNIIGQLGYGIVPLEYNISYFGTGVLGIDANINDNWNLYYQPYYLFSVQGGRKKAIGKKFSSYWLAGLNISYLPNIQTKYELPYGSSNGLPNTWNYQNFVYNPDNSVPFVGIEGSGGIEWHISHKHAIHLDLTAVYTGQKMYSTDYRLEVGGEVSTGRFYRDFNYANFTLGYNYYFYQH